MATAAAAPAVEDSECSICHELLQDPKVLCCGHVLCAPCLVSWVTSQQNAPCPLCCRPILPPDWTQSVQSFVDSLPTDVALKALVDSQQLLSQDHTCQSCLTQAASSLCLHCHDFFCSSCVAIHNRQSATRHHQVEPLSSLTPQKLSTSSSHPCHIHPTELSQLYCSSHKTAICLRCFASKHRNCREVKDIEERAAETLALLTDMVTELTDRERAVDQALQELNRLDQDIEKVEQAAVADINTTFDELLAALKQQRLQALEELKKKVAPAKSSIKDTRASLLESRGLMRTHRNIAERGKGMTACSEMGDMAVALKKRVEDMADSAVVPADAQVIATTTFAVSPDAVSAAQRAIAQLELSQKYPSTVPADVGVNSTAASAVSHDTVSAPQRASAQLKLGELSATPQEAVQFCFHTNCGKKIKLTNNRQTAVRKTQTCFDGIILGSQAMVPQHLYEVHVDEIQGGRDCYLLVGVVTTAPGSLTLPNYSDEWPSAVVFGYKFVNIHGTKMESVVGKKLLGLTKGQRAGVMIDHSHHLHLFIDGADVGQVDTPLPQPCFPLFDIWDRDTQVQMTAMTVKGIS